MSSPGADGPMGRQTAKAPKNKGRITTGHTLEEVPSAMKVLLES